MTAFSSAVAPYQVNFTVAGFGFYGAGQNTGIVFTRLKDFDQRKGYANSAQAITQRAFPQFMQIRDAMVFPIVPPSVAKTTLRCSPSLPA